MTPEQVGLPLTRRMVLRLLAAAAVVPSRAASAEPLRARPIPSSGEMLPVVGLGTWRTFDVGAGAAERAPLKEVLGAFVEPWAAASSIPRPCTAPPRRWSATSPAELGVADKLFLATKVWTSGREAGLAQMEQSFRRLRARRLDLMQIHNLLDWRDPAAHAARLEGGRPPPLRRRHPLHGGRVRRARARAARRAAGLRPGQLLARRARGGAAHPAAGPRARRSPCS